MAPVEFTARAAATPETIWRTCIEPMKWESWDPDLREVKEVSGNGKCEEGTTCIFAMNDGQDVPVTITNVVRDKSVDFGGAFLKGTIRAEGKLRIRPIDTSTSEIYYSFELLGLVGMLVTMVKRKDVVGGTKGGLDNIVKLSEEAQMK
ncbi:hypothetical protein ACHAXA_009632 [Cyclostephanos tholiformis]|jgi:hypothetical protein|uniref:Polyketide cyclase/dehydrase n=1 Tax=Cyclostephanos tholiformis TaxID=382380 RepID=A0ABD3SE11_9STRA